MESGRDQVADAGLRLPKRWAVAATAWTLMALASSLSSEQFRFQIALIATLCLAVVHFSGRSTAHARHDVRHFAVLAGFHASVVYWPREPAWPWSAAFTFAGFAVALGTLVREGQLQARREAPLPDLREIDAGAASSATFSLGLFALPVTVAISSALDAASGWSMVLFSLGCVAHPVAHWLAASSGWQSRLVESNGDAGGGSGRAVAPPERLSTEWTPMVGLTLAAWPLVFAAALTGNDGFVAVAVAGGVMASLLLLAHRWSWGRGWPRPALWFVWLVTGGLLGAQVVDPPALAACPALLYLSLKAVEWMMSALHSLDIDYGPDMPRPAREASYLLKLVMRGGASAGLILTGPAVLFVAAGWPTAGRMTMTIAGALALLALPTVIPHRARHPLT